MRLTEAEIEKLIEEDVPYFDLTSHLLNLKNTKAEIIYSVRESSVVCGTEECARIFEKFNVKVEKVVESGTAVEKGEVIISGKGRGDNVHKVWKVCQNLLEYCSGIATGTRRLIEKAKSINPQIEVFTTRKTFPLAKKICIKGILCGGALPHRLGLSETVLIFRNHAVLKGGLKNVLKELPFLKKKAPEKKIIVEAETVEEALECIVKGADIVQLDKFSIQEIKEVVRFRDSHNPQVKIAAAGGIREENVKEFAKSGADFLVLTSVYFSKPIDVKVEIVPC